MTGELVEMGARTPHELMRCVEVTFIRDCAELAARTSLVREESRWGLYHSRADIPARNDDDWFFHLNVRRRADGATELLRRPVASYVVPVDDVEIPAGAPQDVAVLARGRAAAAGGPGRGGVRPRGRRGAPLAAGAGAARARRERPRPRGPGALPRRSRTRRCAAPPSRPSPRWCPRGPDPRWRPGCSTTTGPCGTPRPWRCASWSRCCRPTRRPGLRCSESLAAPDPIARAAVLDVLRALRLGDAGTFARRLLRRRPAGPPAGRPRAGVARRRGRGRPRRRRPGPRGAGRGGPRPRHDRARRRRRTADRAGRRHRGRWSGPPPSRRRPGCPASRSCGGSPSRDSRPPSGRSAWVRRADWPRRRPRWPFRPLVACRRGSARRRPEGRGDHPRRVVRPPRRRRGAGTREQGQRRRRPRLRPPGAALVGADRHVDVRAVGLPGSGAARR